MKHLFLLIIVFAAFSVNSFSQCSDFARREGIALLDTAKYLQSGNFNAEKLSEGEEIQIFKSLTKGMSYRFVICGSSDLPQNIEFEITDFKGKKILFSNKENNYVKVWDFTPEKSQRVLVSIRVPVVKKSEKPQTGCVAVVTGFKKKGK